MYDPLLGQHLGNYRIDSVIGRGGMAVVYYGWDENLQRPVAVKVIDARYREDPAYTERFVQEARSVAAWRHDNILQIFYAGQQNDLYYFAMEYVDGLDLARVMKQYAGDSALMQYDDVLKIGWAVAKALDYAHKKGIIHRDVKPSNVMIGKDGRITLTDFGLAMSAQQGSFGGTFGSPHYIAPEQARNSAMAVPQSDLYALGVILYEMLTGSVPFNDPSPMVLAVQHLTKSPPPPRQVNPNLSEAVENVLMKALSKQPADRYQSGAALMNALAAALNQSSNAVFQDSVALPVLSRTSVAERVSLYMPPPGLQQPSPALVNASSSSSPPPSSGQASPSSTGRRFGVAAMLVAAIGLCLLLGVGWALFGSGAGEAIANLITNPSPTVVVGVEPAETETAASPSETTSPPEIESTAQITPVDTAVSDTPPTESPTTSDEQTPIFQPTDTPNPEATNPPAVEPTVTLPAANPGGLRLILLYNLTSFYVYNTDADTRVQVSQLSFESLDANGQFSGFRFEGVRWAQFYSFLNPMRCVRLEVPPTGWLRPSQCGHEYNSTVTPEEDGELVFWTPRNNVVAFRVMWQGEEIGQCDVQESQCEVFLP